MSLNRSASIALMGLLAGLAMATPARAQWSIASTDGKGAFNLGFLVQPQVEALQSPGSQDCAQNLFVRRARLLFSGRIDDRTSFNFVTDVPNLGKGQATGAKVSNTMVLQDAVVTEVVAPGVKVDAGMLLVPVSHNSQQSASSILAVDYGPYSYLASDATDSKAGRDYGVNGRAYLANRHAEVRAGLYQGDRLKNSTAPFRTTFRGVFYPYTADTGFTYAGTAFGKKKMVALGASYDTQKSYYAWAGDVFVDWPVLKDCVTFQADYIRYDGRTMFAALPRQDVLLVEFGYFVHQAHVSPYVQYASRDYDAPGRADEAKIQGGLAFWGNGHKNNVKVGVAKLTKDRASDGIQYVAQWQVLAN
jgi:hypothetical protein